MSETEFYIGTRVSVQLKKTIEADMKLKNYQIMSEYIRAAIRTELGK